MGRTCMTNGLCESPGRLTASCCNPLLRGNLPSCLCSVSQMYEQVAASRNRMAQQLSAANRHATFLEMALGSRHGEVAAAMDSMRSLTEVLRVLFRRPYCGNMRLRSYLDDVRGPLSRGRTLRLVKCLVLRGAENDMDSCGILTGLSTSSG